MKNFYRFILPVLLLLSLVILYFLEQNSAMPLPQWAWTYFIIDGCILVLVTLILSEKSRHSLKQITMSALAISRGDYSKRFNISKPFEYDELAKAINRLSYSLEDQLGEISSEKNQLKTILDGMIEGVMVTDVHENIVLVNPAFEKMFNVGDSLVGKPVLDGIRNNDMAESVKRVTASQIPQERELNLFIGLQERHMIAHTAPLFEGPDVFGSVSVFYDVTEIRKLEGVRRDFVANVSHELKTPLTSIRGYSETLLNGAMDDKESARNFLQKIESNSLHLQNLVEDLLKLSQIESGNMELKFVSTDAGSLVRSLCRDFSEMAATRQVHFELEEEQNPRPILVDALALRQILSNLIENAIKYNKSEGLVKVSMTQNEKETTFTIKDSGLGIPEKDLPRIFERFYRVDKARSRASGGTGLGLSIVKHLVVALEGDIDVKSTVGVGTCFTFKIPNSH